MRLNTIFIVERCFPNNNQIKKSLDFSSANKIFNLVKFYTTCTIYVVGLKSYFVFICKSY